VSSDCLSLGCLVLRVLSYHSTATRSQRTIDKESTSQRHSETARVPSSCTREHKVCTALPVVNLTPPKHPAAWLPIDSSGRRYSHPSPSPPRKTPIRDDAHDSKGRLLTALPTHTPHPAAAPGVARHYVAHHVLALWRLRQHFYP
jgi:hypothetical protein